MGKPYRQKNMFCRNMFSAALRALSGRLPRPYRYPQHDGACRTRRLLKIAGSAVKRHAITGFLWSGMSRSLRIRMCPECRQWRTCFHPADEARCSTLCGNSSRTENSRAYRQENRHRRLRPCRPDSGLLSGTKRA